MFAIIRLGNKQFRVKAGDFIRVPFQNHSRGDKIDVPVVAFLSEKDRIWDKSKLKSAGVKAILVRQLLDRKILVFKKKRRKGYRRTRGHRQKISELQILELKSPEGKLSQVKWKGKAQTDQTAKTESKSSQRGLKSASVSASQTKVKKKKSHKKVQKQAVQAKKSKIKKPIQKTEKVKKSTQKTKGKMKSLKRGIFYGI